LWTLPPISCGSLGWYKPMWTMYNLEWFEIGQPPSPLSVDMTIAVDIGAIAPTICARLAANKYFFFANPKCHPCTGVGCQATDLSRGVVARVREKIVFIGKQTCTNCWRYHRCQPHRPGGQNMPATLKMTDLEYNSHCMPLE
jgi:hypothetical protein